MHSALCSPSSSGIRCGIRAIDLVDAREALRCTAVVLRRCLVRSCLEDGLCSGCCSCLLLSLFEKLFWVTVEEEIDWDVPRGSAVNAACDTEAQHFACEQVEEETNTVLGLVVAGDGNVDMAER